MHSLCPLLSQLRCLHRPYLRCPPGRLLTHALLLLLFPPPCLASLPARVGTLPRAMMLMTRPAWRLRSLENCMLTRLQPRLYFAMVRRRHALHIFGVAATWVLRGA